MVDVSRSTQRVTRQLRVEPEEEEEIQAALGQVMEAEAKGNAKKTTAAQRNLEKVVKKCRSVKMQDITRAMKKAGVEGHK